ncbi:MAG TPA: SsrA-binding protein SmpB [Patescibacteria group bacterium]|nr:SsrA-binding protein SmpB [Patescibacteria group bacterium]
MQIFNKRASFDYALYERIEAGIMLTGAEVKAVRLGHADLTGSHVRILGNEVFLINVHIFPYQYTRSESGNERRSRKLLLHRKEITALRSKIEGQNLTIVPVKLYTSGRLIKAELALAKGKKQYEKREGKKRKDLERELAQDLS